MHAATFLGIAGTSTLAAAGVVAGARFRGISNFALRHDTAVSRARDNLKKRWAHDPFIAAERRHVGDTIATYAMPGSDEQIAVKLGRSDLRQHVLALGATGTGKSTLLENLALLHLRRERPFALLDLHGDLFARVERWTRVAKPERLIRLDFTKPDELPSWNPLDPMPGVDPGRQVDLLVGVLKRLYAAEHAASWAWGVKVEELARHALRACIESESTIAFTDLASFFLLDDLRFRVLSTASDASKHYFVTRYGAREAMYASALLNKLEPLFGSLAVQRFLGAQRSTVDLFGAIERGDTILVNLAKGYLGPTADVIGRMLVNVLQTAALAREHVRPEKRHPYWLLLDEAHVLAAPESGLEDFLVAARKYGVFVTLASQGLSLFPPAFRPHLLGNTGRQFFFRLPYSEAHALANDVLEPLGTIWRDRMLPEREDRTPPPLLLPNEEMAWRTRDLANLPIGVAYYLAKAKPYKGRRVEILAPVKPPRGRASAAASDGN